MDNMAYDGLTRLHKRAREISPLAEYLGSGANGDVYDLGDGRAMKFTDTREELDTAQFIMLHPHPSVIPVLDVGADYYIMAKGEANETGLWPSVSHYTHYDSCGPSHNVVMYNGQPVWIDLDGVEPACDQNVSRHIAECSWDTHLPTRRSIHFDNCELPLYKF